MVWRFAPAFGPPTPIHAAAWPALTDGARSARDRRPHAARHPRRLQARVGVSGRAVRAGAARGRARGGARLRRHRPRDRDRRHDGRQKSPPRLHHPSIGVPPTRVIPRSGDQAGGAAVASAHGPRRGAPEVGSRDVAVALRAAPERGGELFSTISGSRSSRSRRPSRPTSTTSATSATRARSRSRAACIRRCTAAGSGRCGSSRASARRRRRTSASATCSSTGRPGSRRAFDMPTLMGYDSDHPRSLGEVGREGVAVDSLDGHGDALRRASRSARSRRR